MIYDPVSDLTIATFLTVLADGAETIRETAIAVARALYGASKLLYLANPYTVGRITLRRSGAHESCSHRPRFVAPRLRILRRDPAHDGRRRRRRDTGGRRDPTHARCRLRRRGPGGVRRDRRPGP